MSLWGPSPFTANIVIFEDFLREDETFLTQPPYVLRIPLKVISNHRLNFPSCAKRLSTVILADIVSAEDKRLHLQMPTNKINVSAHCANTTPHARQNNIGAAVGCLVDHTTTSTARPARFARREMSLKFGNDSTGSLRRSAALSQATMRRFLPPGRLAVKFTLSKNRLFVPISRLLGSDQIGKIQTQTYLVDKIT